jgi:hypothetical protein
VDAEMKNIVRLILVVSICFAVVFLVAEVVAFLQIRIDAIRTEPVLSEIRSQDLADAAQRVLPVTLYFATLLGISYTARKGISIPLSIICLAALGMAWAVMIAFGITLIGQFPPKAASEKALNLGEPGLIVSQPDRSLIFLQDPGNMQSPRVVAIPETPLIYQPRGIEQNSDAVNPQSAGFYPALLESNMFFFLNELLHDFDFAASQFKSRFQESFVMFALYAFALVFLLSSLRFVMDMSGWPMANLFLGIIAFRGVLFLERFLDSASTQQFLTSVIGDRFPHRLISPVAFCTLGIVIILYTALIHLGKSRRTIADEDY